MIYQEQANSLKISAVKEPKSKKDLLAPKNFLIFMTFLVVVSLIFTIINWFDNLKIGFALRGNVNQSLYPATNSLTNSFTNNDLANILALQQQDTDLDGLTDYEELYLYKTSPYLADSDSDGYADAEEIKNKENPNCPAGQSCLVAQPATGGSAAALTDISNLSIEQIRQILLDQGVITQEQLATFDDATLRQLYLETLAEIGSSSAQPGAAAGQSSFTELLPETDIDSLTAAQLRALLIDEGGVTAKDLEQLSDEQLLQLWQESLQQSSQ